MTAYDRFGHKLFLYFQNRLLNTNAQNDYYIKHFYEIICNENNFQNYKYTYIK